MIYIAHLALPKYLEQYCVSHGGTFTAHDDEVCINISFNALAESSIRNNVYPYASLDVAKEKGLVPQTGSVITDDGNRKWLRVGSKDLYKKKGRAPVETKDMVYVLTRKGREQVLEDIKTSFLHFFWVGWIQRFREYQKLGYIPEKKVYIESFLESNGIELDDTNYESVMKMLNRYIDKLTAVIPKNFEE